MAVKLSMTLIATNSRIIFKNFVFLYSVIASLYAMTIDFGVSVRSFDFAQDDINREEKKEKKESVLICVFALVNLRYLRTITTT